jgi:hypothetical protein
VDDRFLFSVAAGGGVSSSGTLPEVAKVDETGIARLVGMLISE